MALLVLSVKAFYKYGKERVQNLQAVFKSSKIYKVDLVFTNGIGRWFSFTIGAYFIILWTSYMYIPKRRHMDLLDAKKLEGHNI